MTSGNRKVLFLVVPSIRVGGTENVVMYICRNINKEYFEVKLLVIDRIYSGWQLSGVEIIELHCSSVLKSIPSLLFFLRKQSGNAFFLTFFDHLNVVIGILVGFRLFKPRKWIARSSTSLSTYYNYNNVVVDKLLAHLFYRHCDLLICQSKEMINDFEVNFGFRKDKMRLIYNPLMNDVLVDDFSELSEYFALIGSKSKRFMALGNLRSEKGYFRMIDAFKRIDESVEGCGLFILGDGILREEIQDYVEFSGLVDKVFLFGSILNPTLFLEKADVVLFASYFEGYPNALVEVCKYNLPIVAFADCDVMNEIIIDGGNGFLAHNEDEFVEYSIKALGYKFDETKFNEVVKRHDGEVFISKIEELFKDEY